MALSEEVESRGSRFVVVLVPSGAQVYDDVWHNSFEHAGHSPNEFDPTYPERRIAAFGRQHGIAVLTLRNEFRDAAAGRSAQATPASDLLFFDGRGHFTNRGNGVAAEAIHRFLSEGDGQEILEQIAPRGRIEARSTRRN